MMRNILEVVERIVALKKCGTHTFRGLCPFHTEKTPSFFINTELNSFKCFGCGKGGGVRDILIFTGQIQEADIAEQEIKKSHDEEKMQNFINDFTNSFKAQQYIKKRGFKSIDVLRFNLGYDEKRNSIVFPIYNEKMSLVSMSFGFIDHHDPKYLHSADFVKSDHFFAYYDQIQETNIWIVEGFFDAIRLYKNGYNALCIMGSYLSEQQGAKIARIFANRNIILMLDSDWAGFCGSIKSYVILLNTYKITPLFFKWEETGDPDDLLKSNEIDINQRVVTINEFVLNGFSKFEFKDVVKILNNANIPSVILKNLRIYLFVNNIDVCFETIDRFEDEIKFLREKITKLLDNDISFAFFLRSYAYLLLNKEIYNRIMKYDFEDNNYQNCIINNEMNKLLKQLKDMHIKYELYNLKYSIEILNFLCKYDEYSIALNKYLHLKAELT